MYSPKHYRNDRPELALEIIKRYDFATIVSKGDGGLLISHLPLLLENNELIGHCARANPQWQSFKPGNHVTAVFQGPHSYISPAWYKPKAGNVPTWNYVSVHVSGEASVIENADESLTILKRLSDYHEKRIGTDWSLPVETDKSLPRLVREIVAFRIHIANIDAKFKLSQKQDGADRSVVIRELEKQRGESAEVAKWMGKL